MADTMLIARSRCCQTTRTRARDEHCALRSPSFSNCGTTSATSGLLESQPKTPRFGLKHLRRVLLCRACLRNISGHGRGAPLSPRKEHIDMRDPVFGRARGPCCQADEGRLSEERPHRTELAGISNLTPPAHFVWFGTRESPGHKRRATSWHRTHVFFNPLNNHLIDKIFFIASDTNQAHTVSSFPVGASCPPVLLSQEETKSQSGRSQSHAMHPK